MSKPASRVTKSSRRRFLKETAAGVAAGSLFTISGTKASGNVIGANETIRVGVAGIHGRGGSHIGEYIKQPNVQVSHLIDPDSSLFKGRSKMIEEKAGNTPKCVQDIRDALEDDSLDAVSVASCNHWHSLITFWACQAGKDVYVEKPCSHNVFEGRQIVEAARKYGRIVQHGTQSRASGGWAKQTAAARSGKFGKLLVSKGYCCKPRWSIGFREVEEPPKELDFNIWLGPAPMQPYHRNLVHYNWHWFWDTGNGDVGNQGVHQMDIARWAIAGGTLPKSVVSLGGRWVNEPDYKDQGETPNMLLSIFEFDDTLLVFETRGLVDKTVAENGRKFPRKVDNEFYTTEGVIRGGKFYPDGEGNGESLGDIDYELEPGGIFGNFINCMRSRDASKLNAEILEGHYSSALCHLGNISYRLGEPVPFSQQPRDLPSDDRCSEAWNTLEENLVAALGMDLDKHTYQLGPKLRFDPAKERFVGNAAADKLLTREYREPFVVTKTV